MLRQARRSASVYVAEQANFQRYPLVENVLRQISQLHSLAVHNGDVINEACPVPDACLPTILYCLPDRLFSVAFPGMNRDIEILALDVVKSVHMLFRRISSFFARQIEAQNAPAAK